MDIYHIWCDLKPDVKDIEFTQAVSSYLGHLQSIGSLSSFRLTRRKLGLASAEFGEFHLLLEFENLAQLDAAFTDVSTRNDPVENLHFEVNKLAMNLKFALYRDFPDKNRLMGEEQF